MAEYAGFQEREGTDFAGSINDLATKVSGLESKVKQVRASDKKLLTDNDALLDAHKPFNFTGTTDFAAKTAVTLRQHMYELNRKLNNREISPSNYRLEMQNIRTDHNGLIGLMTTIDDRTLEEKKRLEPGPNGELPIASGIETELYAEMQNFWAELPNKQVFVGPNGKLATAQTDANGKIVEGSIFDLAGQMNVNNIATNRLNLRDGVAKDVKDLGDYSVFTINADGSTKDISAIEMDPDFQTYKKQIAGRYINNNNPKAIASILVDNSNLGYMVYTSEESKKKKIEDQLDILRLGATKESPFDEAKSRREIESKMIQLKQSDNGVWNPVITEELKNAAYNVVSNEIMSQLGYDEKGTGVKVKSGRGGGLTEQQEIGQEEKEDLRYDVYVGASNAFANGNFSAYDTDKYYFKRGVNEQGKPYVYVYDRVKTSSGSDATEARIKAGTLKPKQTLKLPNEAPPFLRYDTGTTPYTSKDYEAGKILFQQRNGRLNFDTEKDYRDTRTTPAASKPAVSKATTQADFNSKWAKLKSGQKLIGPDGKEYTKK
jgi:hypothetical protein